MHKHHHHVNEAVRAFHQYTAVTHHGGGWVWAFIAGVAFLAFLAFRSGRRARMRHQRHP